MNHWQHYWAASPPFQPEKNQFLWFSCHLRNFFFYTRFPETTPSTTGSLWCAERCLNCWNLHGDAWKATTHLGNHSCLSLIQIQKTSSSLTKVFVFLVVWLYFCGFFFLNKSPNTHKSAQIQDFFIPASGAQCWTSNKLQYEGSLHSGKNTEFIQEWDREHKKLRLQPQTHRFLNCSTPK